MRVKRLSFTTDFSVVWTNRRAQAASMTVAPGECEGGPDNRHRGADQWMYVVSGTGKAIVGKRTCPLRAGTLLLIERGETHEIRNTGRTRLKTLNLYVPPAYTNKGTPRWRGRG